MRVLKFRFYFRADAPFIAKVFGDNHGEGKNEGADWGKNQTNEKKQKQKQKRTEKKRTPWNATQCLALKLPMRGMQLKILRRGEALRVSGQDGPRRYVSGGEDGAAHYASCGQGEARRYTAQ